MRGFYLSHIGIQDGYPCLDGVMVVDEFPVGCAVLVSGALEDHTSRRPYRILVGLAVHAHLVKLERIVRELDDHVGLPGVSYSCTTLHK